MDTVGEYLEWGKPRGGHKGRPWSEFHASRKQRQLVLWAETLELKVLADLDNLPPRVEATPREPVDRGKTGKTIANMVHET
jgi:hypothetical protein